VPVALGALVPARLRLDILIESSLIDVSGCHRSHRFQDSLCRRAPHLFRGSKKLRGF
jgi:hypothetical protein